MREPEVGRLSPEAILARPGSTWTQVECEAIYDWLLEPYRYRQLLFWTMRFLGQYATREDAEDAVADFLLKQISPIVQRFTPDRSSFWAFLTVCLRQFCSGVRRQAPTLSLIKDEEEALENSPELIVDSRFDIHRTLEDKESAEALRHAIKILPQDYSSVIVLHYFQGKKIETMALELGISETAAKVRLFRARKLLSELLKGRGKRK